MSVQVQVIVGPDRGQTFFLPTRGTLQIGRSQTTDTRLSDPAVSRLHCQIEFDGERANLLNVSTRGTMVNGMLAQQRDLRHGDVIRIGGTELRFVFCSLAEAETVLRTSDAAGEGTQG
jgi:pSer/pThr/pTyr-binding forkhead associated (FHA) protein